MDKIDLKKIAEDIQNAESSANLMQYLGILWVEFEKEMLTKNVDVLFNIDNIPKLLHKSARKLTPEKAYVCGVYSEKFKQLIEDYNARRVQELRSSVLFETLARNLFEYLHKNGVVEVKKIISDFAVDKTSEEVRGTLKQLLRTDLVSITYASEYDYYGLTAEGYKYYYNYLRKAED